MIALRDATLADLPAILDIYNDVIATTTAVYSDDAVSLEDRRAWWSARVGQGYPVLVADDDGALVGFASFADFRPWPGYRFTVEHSVHVRADQRGCGIGSQLVQALLDRATALGKHTVVGGIDAANAASLRMHERLGFQRVGHFSQVGRKFDRWLDLTFVQRLLDPDRADHPASP